MWQVGESSAAEVDPPSEHWSAVNAREECSCFSSCLSLFPDAFLTYLVVTFIEQISHGIKAPQKQE